MRTHALPSPTQPQRPTRKATAPGDPLTVETRTDAQGQGLESKPPEAGGDRRWACILEEMRLGSPPAGMGPPPKLKIWWEPLFLSLV